MLIIEDLLPCSLFAVARGSFRTNQGLFGCHDEQLVAMSSRRDAGGE